MKTPQPRPGILDVKPYVAGEGRLNDAIVAIRLASNENSLGCSEKAMAAYEATRNEIHRYPDAASADLRASIAETYNMNASRIVCSHGSEELIALLARAYAGPGDEVVCSEYGFAMFPVFATGTGAKLVIAREDNLRTDLDALLNAVTDKTKIVYLANPNNPTGSYVTAAEMKDFCKRLSPEILLIIDSAYAEFVDEKDYSDGRDIVDAHPNAVMLRTFSKIHGLAGLRLGWGYFPEEIAGVLNRIRGTFNVSLPAQVTGVAALGDKEFMARTAALAREGRAYLGRELTALGLKVSPSVCNFLLVEFGPKAEDIRLKLKEQGIFVRQMGGYNLPNHLRLSTGTEDENKRLIKGLAGILRP